MKKIITLIIGLLIYSHSISTNAQVYTLSPGIDINMDFHPGIANEISNPLFWSMTIKCRISAEEPQTLMEATATKNNVSVDGQHLKQGQTRQLAITNGTSLVIKADGSAKVTLTNLSEHRLSAKCST